MPSNILAIMRWSLASAWFESKPAAGEYFTCPVSGGGFEVEEHTRMTEYNGRYYAFCCGGCAQDFAEPPEKFVSKLPKAE
jgi:YHS domain-containing protein